MIFIPLISGIIAVTLIGWNYASNTTIMGMSDLPLYMGILMLAITLFIALGLAFRR